MTSSIKSEIINFQKNLIPSDARNVRFAMIKAGRFSESKNFFSAHILSVLCVIPAVAMSFFNTASYLLQSPFRVAIRIVQFSPLLAVTSLIEDITNIARSFIFVSLGVVFIFGFLYPPIISHFSPEYCDSYEARLRERIGYLEEENKKLSSIKESQILLIQNLRKEITQLKENGKRFWLF